MWSEMKASSAAENEAEEAFWRFEERGTRTQEWSGRVSGLGECMVTEQRGGPLGVRGHAFNERPPPHRGCVSFFSQAQRVSTAWSRRRAGFRPGGVFATIGSPGASGLDWSSTTSSPGWSLAVADSGTSQPP